MQIAISSIGVHGKLSIEYHSFRILTSHLTFRTRSQAVIVISTTTLHPSLQFTTFDILVLRAPFVRRLHPSLGIAAGGTLTQVTGENMVRTVPDA